MERFSPKIEIINHFDNLINRIDIDIDSSLENYNDQQLLSEILKSSVESRLNFRNISTRFNVKIFETIDSSKRNVESWPESTKVVNYLKQIRLKTIEELKKAQEETLDYYKLNSERFKNELTKDITKDIDELRSELFAEKFYFQVNFKKWKNILWVFNVFTIVTDFYLTQSDIEKLE